MKRNDLSKSKGLLLAATLLMSLWAGPVLALDREVTLPFELLGQKKYVSPAKTSRIINGQRCAAYELANVAQDGKVYYLSESRQLLLEDATIEYDKAEPVIACFSTVHVDLLLKGSCTISGQGVLITTKGAVTISAFPDESASLSLSTSQTAIQCATRLTVSHVDVDCPESRYGFACTGGRYADSRLTIDGGTLSLKSSKECVTGFKDIVTVGCGLLFDEYEDQRMVYNKSDYRLTHNGQPCTELPLVSSDLYIPINTTTAAGNWLSQNVKPESPGGDGGLLTEEDPVAVEEEPVAVEEEPVAEEVPAVEEAPMVEEAPTAEAPAARDEKVFDVCEQMPDFAEGGLAAANKFISDNMEYPHLAEEQGIQGRVIVQFIVETDGTISEVKVLKSVDPVSLDREALRVIKLSSGLWRPAKQQGVAVRCRYIMPVIFRLTGKGK